jgi:hypothetical protein
VVPAVYAIFSKKHREVADEELIEV